MPNLPPITDNRPFWDAAYFAARYGISSGAVHHHMRSFLGRFRKGKRRKITFEQALKLDAYIREVRQKPDSKSGLWKRF
jgi:hypothetical protein